MKTKKFIPTLIGATFAALCLMPGHSFAADGNFTLAGTANQTSSTFSVAVREDTGATTVNYAEADLSFSAPVTNVSVSFSGSPFAQQSIPCSTTVCVAGGIASGSVSGSNTVATISFTMPQPGSVTISFAGSALYHPNPGSFSTAVTATTVPGTFTYTAPAQPPTGGGSTTTPGGSKSTGSTGSTSKTSTSTTTPAVKGDATTQAATATDSNTTATSQKADSTKTPVVVTSAAKTSSTGQNVALWILGLVLALVVAASALYEVRRKAALKAKAAKKVVAHNKATASKHAVKTKKVLA